MTPEPDAPRPRRRRLLLAVAVAVVVVLVVAGGVLYVTQRGGDVSNPNVEFQADEATPTAEPERKRRKDPEAAANKVSWPFYGNTADRRRVESVPSSFRGPFRKRWTFIGNSLLEFPPAMAKKSLYLLQDSGSLNAVSKRTGNTRWRKDLGKLAASSPAYHRGRLYATVLVRKSGAGGRVVALRASDGKILWSRDLPSRTESSPVVADGAVYFGTENGTVYALRESDGGVRWTYKAAGAVKGGPALKSGRLYFGDYAGKVYAVRERDGKEVWQATTSGAKFGFSSGQFYSTPAVAYGRVYLGNTDSYVYSFSARSGQLAWRTKTNGYVYASPAVGQVSGSKPMVYAGSYDGTFYALDAKSGKIRWSHGGGSKISGGATLLGDVVYFSDLGHRRTLGLGARTGKQVFDYPRGGYNPAVTDGRDLFLVGYGAMYALRPLSEQRRERIAARKQAARRRAAKKRTARRHRCAQRARRAHRGHKGAQRRSFRRCVRR